MNDLPEGVHRKEVDPETGETVYYGRVSFTPEEAARALGALEATRARLEYALRNPLPPTDAPQTPERAEPQPEEGSAASFAPRDPEQLLTVKEVGEILGIPTKSVYELGGLERVQVGERRVRWRLSDVRAFIERRRERF